MYMNSGLVFKYTCLLINYTNSFSLIIYIDALASKRSAIRQKRQLPRVPLPAPASLAKTRNLLSAPLSAPSPKWPSTKVRNWLNPWTLKLSLRLSLMLRLTLVWPEMVRLETRLLKSTRWREPERRSHKAPGTASPAPLPPLPVLVPPCFIYPRGML